MVYKTDRYASLIQKLNKARLNRDRIFKNASTLESTTPNLTKKQKEKQALKKKAASDDVSTASANIAGAKGKYNFLGMAIQFLQFRYLSSTHSSTVVAVLPFEPISLFRRVTQRGLTGLEGHPKAVSWFCVYMLCNFAIKGIFVKALAVARGEDSETGGVGSMLSSPQMRKTMKKLGYTDEDLEFMNNLGKGVGM
ncbi:hypothetical protein TrCOL_g10265 [Triparma columacea]|uniref:Calcium load-activated calcium channel n=1 Tax=Triparma columacea TaxID=722753 RepID=A0A9W7L476_9STRA|nr:hypothetical protein TrCOL_g10265 [Triparma columacea]